MSNEERILKGKPVKIAIIHSFYIGFNLVHAAFLGSMIVFVNRLVSAALIIENTKLKAIE